MGDDLDDVTQTVSDHVIADAVTVRTRPSRPSDLDPDVPEGHCTNCETELKGQVCHVCGQVDDRYHRPFYSLIMEALDGLLSFDGRAWKTLPPLVVFPGRITRKYLSGSRARFIPPFRVYIIASLIFFLIFGLRTNDLTFNSDGLSNAIDFSESIEEMDERLAAGEISQEEYDELMLGIRLLETNLPGLNLDEDDGEPTTPQDNETTPEDPDSNTLTPEEEVLGELSQSFNLNLGEDNSEFNEFIEEVGSNIINDPRAWGEASLAWLPRIMFVMVPIYAGLLALTYLWRRGYFFYDHMVVSLHFHAALFLAMSVIILISPIIGFVWSFLFFLVYSNVYLYRLHRHVYSRSVFTSILRVFFLNNVYFIFLSAGLMAVIFLGAMSL